MSGRRSVAAGLVAVAILFSATGCLRAQAEVHVSEDGTGAVALQVTTTRFDLGTTGDTADAWSRAKDAMSSFVGGRKVVGSVHEGRRKLRAVIPFDDLGELTDIMVGSGGAALPVPLFSTFHVVRNDDDQWRMGAVVDPVGVAALESVLVGVVPDHRLQASDVSVDLLVSLPGEVATSSSADADGGASTWRLDGTDAATTISMVNTPADAGVWLIGLVAVSGLAMLAYVLVLTSSRGTTELASTVDLRAPGGGSWLGGPTAVPIPVPVAAGTARPTAGEPAPPVVGWGPHGSVVDLRRPAQMRPLAAQPASATTSVPDQRPAPLEPSGPDVMSPFTVPPPPPIPPELVPPSRPRSRGSDGSDPPSGDG